MDLLSTLNPAQQQAVSATECPVLALTCPGSGKTRVLIHRVGHLIQDLHVEPWHIMAVTFTNKAARERSIFHRHRNGTVSQICGTIFEKLRNSWNSCFQFDVEILAPGTW